MSLTRFNDDDLDILRQMADWFRKRKPTPNRGRVIETESFSPDVYVALTPVGGIWPLSGEHSTGTGTGTGTSIGAGNSPGYAECDIYKIEYNEQTPNLVSAGFTRTVHNLMTVAIPGNAWVLVMRDKWGSWFVPPLAGFDVGECA
jgi:hypothetical protein